MDKKNRSKSITITIESCFVRDGPFEYCPAVHAAQGLPPKPGPQSAALTEIENEAMMARRVKTDLDNILF